MNTLQVARAIVENPAFITKDITGDGKAETFCNWGLRMFAQSVFGYNGFNDLSANAIHAKVRTDASWKKLISAEAADEAASAGRLVIAAQTNPAGSGHVAAVVHIPGTPIGFSGKWSRKAPHVANVGTKNGIMTANFAFSIEPEYFALIS